MSVTGKEITTKEIFDLISFNTNVSTKKVEEVMDYLRLIIVQELKNYKTINIDGLGRFSVIEVGGHDVIRTRNGIERKEFMERESRIQFRVSPLIKDLVRGKVKDRHSLRMNKFAQKRFEERKMKVYHPDDIGDIANDYFIRKEKKKEKKYVETEICKEDYC